jgi:2-C-methyl-D-erythritol 2,4-cyclodiphosphate synthase
MSPAGIGFDSHRLQGGRPLILGGVQIPDTVRGLVGWSDADVLTHALIDALLGAAGLGDIGQHFPDTDERWRGADSVALLVEVARMVGAAGLAIGNVDCAVVCERPKLAPMRDEMQRRLSEAVGAPVTIKGNRAEGLGAIGRVEGIACFAVAVVSAEDAP